MQRGTEGGRRAGDVEPGTDATAEERRDFCPEEVDSYKHSREIEFVDELPRTTSGEVQKYKPRRSPDGTYGRPPVTRTAEPNLDTSPVSDERR